MTADASSWVLPVVEVARCHRCDALVEAKRERVSGHQRSLVGICGHVIVDRLPMAHGLASTYDRAGCRCDYCRKAKAIYAAAQYARRRAS